MDTYGDPGDRAPNPIFREHSLLPAKKSLFPEIFSLLVCVGNFTRSRCGTAVSRNEIRFRGTKIAKFPVNFPVSRELPTGDRFVSDCAHHHPVFPNRGNRLRSKRGRFCGDPVTYFQGFRSLPRLTVSPLDFWSPVSASKNSVPGS